jgi:hypothetical protein
MASFDIEWNMNDDFKDMRKLLSYALSRLHYKGNRKNYQEIAHWINKYQHFSPPNIERNEENIIEEAPPIIESNLPVNQNFIPNENMAQQGIYVLHTDPAMEAFINLVGKQRKEIRKMEKLMIPQRASEFVYAQNHRKNKNEQWVDKTNKKFDMLNE